MAVCVCGGGVTGCGVAWWAGYSGQQINQADVGLLQYPLSMPMDPTLALRDLDYYTNKASAGQGVAWCGAGWCVVGRGGVLWGGVWQGRLNRSQLWTRKRLCLPSCVAGGWG